MAAFEQLLLPPAWLGTSSLSRFDLMCKACSGSTLFHQCVKKSSLCLTCWKGYLATRSCLKRSIESSYQLKFFHSVPVSLAWTISGFNAFFPLLYVDLQGQLHANVNYLENFKVVSLQCIFIDSWSCCLFFTSGNPRLTEVKPLHRSHSNNVGYGLPWSRDKRVN